ncbi:hypothetical protein [Cohnella candidum]|uniref:Uncharacterized protein n=1 Tax=Cohnella candidum TaxID=2674991 RepID=A0A3G3JUF0_9BACL|nr:hypothetical protein [Cohnella candidum]AYQ71852.1 hypothetical protein EAV92_04300 [Cohnella candidum]
MANTSHPRAQESPLKRLLDPSQPFCREDVLWALHHVKRKAAEGAPEWSGLDRPQLIECFACFAEMALLLLHKQTPGQPETACFRVMLRTLFAAETA